MTKFNDARLWALMLGRLRTAGLEGPAAERLARQLVADVRNEALRTLRTFGRGDSLPDPPPSSVRDLDGDLWEHQDAGRGCYRMSARDRARNADSTEDVEGVRLWPFLLDEYGPLTEVARHSHP
ncbi:hypothetical protein ACXJJ3_41985 (plasmid) [Kribbella sp. WER1]